MRLFLSLMQVNQKFGEDFFICNHSPNIVDKFSEPNRIGFCVKCFRGDFLKFSNTAVKMFIYNTAVKMFIYAEQLVFGFNCYHFRIFVENSLFPKISSLRHLVPREANLHLLSADNNLAPLHLRKMINFLLKKVKILTK